MQLNYGPRVLALMGGVTVLGLPVLVVSALDAVRAGTAAFPGHLALVVALFSVVLVVGEMRPIPIARGEESGDEITVSSTFGFALLLVAPVFFAVAAQAVALVLDWQIRRRPWESVPFNIAQYCLAFVAARAVYAELSGQPHLPVPFEDPHLGAACAAGLVFLAVNNGLVAAAVSLHARLPLRAVLLADARWQLSTSAPLLGLGTLAAHAALWDPLAVALLLLPIVALHRSGQAAMRREQEALHDPLTGLANRALLRSAAERALTGDDAVALLLLDLDHFKDVNDTLGHAVGDQLLLAVSDRLREQAGPGDLVARLGGDEFVLLHPRCSGPDEAQELARRLGEAVREPYEVAGVTLTVGCSIGIGLAPDHADDVEGLLRCADVALYEAKVVRGTHALYDRSRDQHSAELLGRQADLRAALEDPDDTSLWVAYQPQLDLRTHRISSVECLVRWTHPVAGPVPPDSFVPIAESTSLIDALMARVLRTALAQLRTWEAEGVVVDVAVNLSARQLSDLTLPSTVLSLLAEHDVAPQRLLLEVTESRLMSDPERSTRILGRLKDAGIGISIDDFGTGYSSLAYLQRLDVDELKIDKSFIRGLAEPGNAAIVRSTIELGHNLGLRVVAEGVEDEQDVAALRAMGCDVLQGYALGRPGAADEVTPLLRGGRLAPVPAPRAPSVSPVLLSDRGR